MHLPIQHGTAVIVDGNTFQRKMLRSILRTSGFSRVSEFDKIEFGLDEAKRTFPNFLFLDYDTASASELVRGRQDISKTHLNESTYLIIILENPTRHRVGSAIAHGAHWVVSRPFSTNALIARIRAAQNSSNLESYKTMTKALEYNLAKQSAHIASRGLDPVSLGSVTASTTPLERDSFFEEDIFDDYDEIFQRSTSSSATKNKTSQDEDAFLI